MSVVDEVIKACGGLGPTADKCGLKYQAIQKWKKSGVIPLSRVLLVERVSGVPRERLRPDIFRSSSASRLKTNRSAAV